MKTKMFHNFIFYPILMLGLNEVSTISDWTTTLAKHVTETLKPFQVIFLMDNEIQNQHSHTETMIEKIGQAIPTKKLSFQSEIMQGDGYSSVLKWLENPRGTTLFVIVHFPRDDGTLKQLRNPVEFISRIAPIRSRPKCLMVLSTRNKTLNYKKILRFMWSKKFLDATVLEIIEEASQKKWLLNVPIDSIKIQYLNPFTKMFIKKKFGSKTRLFPQKLQNLHGLTMKVGLQNVPFFTYVKRNSTGHPIEARGSDVLLSKVLSSKMNFKMSMIPSNIKNWGKFSCNREKTTGYIYKLCHNEIQFISNLLAFGFVCQELISESTMVYDFMQIVAVTPILKNPDVSYLDPWRCAFPIVLIALITIIVQTFERKLNFETPFHHWHYILQPLLGAAIVETPRGLKERIVLACLLITGMTYVSFIFSSMTETMVQEESKIKMEDLDDLYKSGLRPMINEEVHRYIFSRTEGINRQILEKAVKSPFSDLHCFEMLKMHKNVSCFMPMAEAQSFLADSTKVGIAQILKQPLMTSFGTMWMEPATPYVDRFNEIITLLIQSGIYRKWMNDYAANETLKIKLQRSDNRVELDSKAILFQILLFMLTGYTVSFLVFLAELTLFN